MAHLRNERLSESVFPRYDELPVHPVLGLPYAWGVLDPCLGTLMHADAAALVDAAAGVREGERIPLNLSLGTIEPPLFGRARLTHSVHAQDRNTFEDVLDSFNPQSSSQWDGFRHVRAREFGFFGGITEIADDDTETLSIEHFARSGIAGRGVLLDIAAWCVIHDRPLDPFSGRMIEADLLHRIADDQGLELRGGDILCLRFGWVSGYRQLSDEQRSSPDLCKSFVGLRSDESTARFLWDMQFAAVCSDNPALESAPGNALDGSLHRRLLPMLGMVMGELLDFDTLAARCAQRASYDFLFVAVPLPVPGGLSSPSNAMAIL